MEKRFKILLTTIFVMSLGLIICSCKNKEPSTLKIYVRSATTNELLSDVKVVIVGDVNSNPKTLEYVDTVTTNGSGYATFNMQPYFDKANEKENPTGYFKVILRKNNKMLAVDTPVRCRVHIATVETINFNN